MNSLRYIHVYHNFFLSEFHVKADIFICFLLFSVWRFLDWPPQDALIGSVQLLYFFLRPHAHWVFTPSAEDFRN